MQRQPERAQMQQQQQQTVQQQPVPADPAAPPPGLGHRTPFGRQREPEGRRELIVVTRREVGLRAAPPSAAGPQRLEAEKPAEAAQLSSLLQSFEASLRPLFGVREDRMARRLQAMPDGPPSAPRASPRRDLSRFYTVLAPEQRLEELADMMRQQGSVEAAYVKPAGALPVLNDMTPSAATPPAVTPNFEARQGYLDPAPNGIDAHHAWRKPGGRASGVHIIDLEWGWRFRHEDLQQTCGVVAGISSDDDDHGTAVLGEICGGDNGFGIKGICPDARVSTVSFSLPTAEAILIAADRAKPGDILLLEIHRGGPRDLGDGSQFGFIPVEWWPDDYEAIRYAVDKGVIVVEAAGNGFQDLDDPIYDTAPPGFPLDWVNPLNPRNLSSEAVLVGAGAPPRGTHGKDWGADRSRLDFSNHGARVDAQGWGREVTTTGYGDLQGGWNRNEWYTDEFSGTSSASPIVVGALACIQGMLRAAGRPLLDSPSAIDLLRATGSPQQHEPGRPAGQRIGNLPDLRAMASHLGL